MAVEPKRLDSWPLGANNVDKPQRLPAGAVRELRNFDPSAGGTLDLRAGFEQVVTTTDARGAFAVQGKIVVVDGTDLVAFDEYTSSPATIASLTAASGPVAGAVLNDMLYLHTLQDSLTTDGEAVYQWGVTAPSFSIELIAGNLPSGIYKVAVTAVGDQGQESGTPVATISVPAGSALRVSSPDSGVLRVYVSAQDSAELYFQTLLLGGAVAITDVADNKEPLTTGHLTEMPACEELVAYHGVLVGRRDNYVFFTDPMYPHLTDPVRCFFQYGARVTMLAATDGGVYIAADKTYFVSDFESEKPQQRKVLEFGAVEGSAVTLPDGSAAWFSKYGQVMGAAGGSVTLPNQRTYAPNVAAVGAAGYLDHNGNQLLVTTMHGATQANNLATGDFAELEIDDGN